MSRVLNPAPAQEDDFLQLHYGTESSGSPQSATTNLYQHPWSVHDQIGLAGSIEITKDKDDDGYHVIFTQYSWLVFGQQRNSTGAFWLEDAGIMHFQTAESLPTFQDAEELALFAWKRWRATGRPASSGLVLVEAR